MLKKFYNLKNLLSLIFIFNFNFTTDNTFLKFINKIPNIINPILNNNVPYIAASIISSLIITNKVIKKRQIFINKQDPIYQKLKNFFNEDNSNLCCKTLFKNYFNKNNKYVENIKQPERKIIVESLNKLISSKEDLLKLIVDQDNKFFYKKFMPKFIKNCKDNINDQIEKLFTNDKFINTLRNNNIFHKLNNLGQVFPQYKIDKNDKEYKKKLLIIIFSNLGYFESKQIKNILNNDFIDNEVVKNSIFDYLNQNNELTNFLLNIKEKYNYKDFNYKNPNFYVTILFNLSISIGLYYFFKKKNIKLYGPFNIFPSVLIIGLYVLNCFLPEGKLVD